MEKLEAVKNEIKANVKWGRKTPNTGGQTVGMPHMPVTLRSEELDLDITIGYHRSVLKNRELAYTLFELALDELVK